MNRRSLVAAAAVLGLAGQVHAVRGVVGARPGDDPRPVPDRFEDGPKQPNLLVIGGGR